MYLQLREDSNSINDEVMLVQVMGADILHDLFCVSTVMQQVVGQATKKLVNNL
jgi:hypothetical protein